MDKKRICSRSKGKRVEREAAHKLNDVIGGEWIRSQQHAGSPDAPDIKSSYYPRLIIEVKGDERLNVFKAMEQADGYCTERSIPVVQHKKNNKPFLITIKADDLREFVESVSQGLSDIEYESELLSINKKDNEDLT